MTLSEQILHLEPTPSAAAGMAGVVMEALRSDSTSEATADSLIHESTRLALNWMGTGDRSSLNAYLESLRSALAEAEVAPALLSGLSGHERLAVKLLELGRVVSVYLRSNNAAREVGALGGARRAVWRDVMGWACGLAGPFTPSDVREAGFYARRRASANEALEAMVEEGLLARQDVDGNVTYTVTWAGRDACRAVIGNEDVGHVGELGLERAELDALRDTLEAERQVVDARHRALLIQEARLAEERRGLEEERRAWYDERAQAQAALQAPAY
jgi:hypothetical protein